jgi:hypothetical protein
MATATRPQNDISVEMAEEMLVELFADHLDTLTPDARRRVLDDLSESAGRLESKPDVTS